MRAEPYARHNCKQCKKTGGQSWGKYSFHRLGVAQISCPQCSFLFTTFSNSTPESKQKPNESWCPCCSPSCYLGFYKSTQDLKHLPLLRNILLLTHSFLETGLHVAQAGLDQGMQLKMALFLVHFHVCVVHVMYMHVCITWGCTCMSVCIRAHPGGPGWSCGSSSVTFHLDSLKQSLNQIPNSAIFYINSLASRLALHSQPPPSKDEITDRPPSLPGIYEDSGTLNSAPEFAWHGLVTETLL